MSLYSFIDRKIIPYIFSFSQQPMLFRELLVANKMYNDGIKLEDNMAGFKIRLARLYGVFVLVWHLFIIPLLAIFHMLLVQADMKMDCHLSIVLAVVFTIIFFSSFSLYREWLVQRVAIKLIQKGWQNHFPHFDFSKNSQKVANIYAQAIEDGIPNKELEMYMMNNLVK
jgi:hypothetical protein